MGTSRHIGTNSCTARRRRHQDEAPSLATGRTTGTQRHHRHHDGQMYQAVPGDTMGHIDRREAWQDPAYEYM